MSEIDFINVVFVNDFVSQNALLQRQSINDLTKKEFDWAPNIRLEDDLLMEIDSYKGVYNG